MDKPDKFDDNYVPKDLEESISLLVQKNWDDLERIRTMTEDELNASVHHSIGRWMRNNWGLWAGDSDLAMWFKAKGIHHPDDMTGIILKSFHRRVTGKEIGLEDQIQFYMDYWEQYGTIKK